MDYQRPVPLAPAFSLRLAITYTFVAAIESLIFVFAIPKFEEIFKNFGAPLPALTVVMIWISKTYAWILLWILPPLMGFLPLLVNPSRAPEQPQHRLLRVLIHLLILLAITITTVLGLFLPYISIINSLSK